MACPDNSRPALWRTGSEKHLALSAQVGLVSLFVILTVFGGIFAEPANAQKARIKDLVNVRGVRANHLVGFGLVVGLQGSGDSQGSLTTNRAVANMLTRLGMRTDAQEVVGGNVAAVVATAELPPFAKTGDQFDVKLSTVGDAQSLAGGTLVLTPLKGGDDRVYAVAQGAVVVGQANGDGPQVLTTARVPGGATVEREFEPDIAADGSLTLSLREPDFTTANRVAEAVNGEFRGFYAKPETLSTLRQKNPPRYEDETVSFMARLEKLRVEPDAKARVVLNERTGTVVMGEGIVVGPVSIAHGDLSVRIREPGDEAGGENGEEKPVVPFGGTTVGDLVDTMNALGVSPSDLVGIIQAVGAAGALNAEVEFL